MSTYDPALKFSGKEREPANEMDYFGARYYAHTRYRWISPDPVIDVGRAISSPQLWNLYTYCKNSPFTYSDPYGSEIVYQNADLRSLFESIRRRCSLVNATMALYDSDKGPNLYINYGDAGYETDGSKASGSFNADIVPNYEGKYDQMREGMTKEQIEDLGIWSCNKSTITMDQGRPLSIDDKDIAATAPHELGHADQAARRPLDYKRQSEIKLSPQGRALVPAKRPVEDYANRYAKKALREL